VAATESERRGEVNLDDLVPDRVPFTHEGHRYLLDGDPPLRNVLRLRRIEQVLTDPDAIEGLTEEQFNDYVQEGIDIVERCIVHRPDDAPAELDVGVKKLLILFQLLLREESVAQALVAAMNDGAAAPEAQEDGSPLAEVPGAPLTKRSRTTSGTSAKASPGKRATSLSTKRGSTRNGGTGSAGPRSVSAAAASTSN
jgi:hypothetical protein